MESIGSGSGSVSGAGQSKVDKFITIAGIFAPQVLALTHLAPIAQDVAEAIQATERLIHADGAGKLSYALNLAVLAAQTANHKAGRTVIDPALVQASGATVISSVVASINAIKAVAHPVALGAGTGS